MALTLIERFAKLFSGSLVAYGADYGGCVPLDWPAEDIPWAQHLGGEKAIGIYPLRRDLGGLSAVLDANYRNTWSTRWGCVDLDVKAPHKTRYDFETEQAADEAATRLVRVLGSGFGVAGWIEHTKSNGRHVWVFADGWVPAAIMRRALLVACEVAEVPTTEVNPKQETLAEGQLGNYVRLPYVGALNATRSTERQVYPRNGGAAIPLPKFLAGAECSLARRSNLEQVASLLSFEPKTLDGSAEMKVELNNALLARLSPLTRKILEDGPFEGGDRSGTLCKLAGKCQKDGLSPDETLAVLSSADADWGKFLRRPGGERYLVQIVEKVYQ